MLALMDSNDCVMEPFDYAIALFICAPCTTCSTLLQLYRALRAAAGKEEGTEGSTTVTEHSTVDGLDNLQKYTLAAMQSEIDALREELKKSDKVL